MSVRLFASGSSTAGGGCASFCKFQVPYNVKQEGIIMKRILASLVFTLFTLNTVSAQNYTLPAHLATITPENAAQLTPLAQLGNAAPRGITWSPDGQTLLTVTDDGTYRYELNNLD